MIHGDCLAVLPTLDAESVDAVVCDPPYHLTTGNISMDFGALGPNGPKDPYGRIGKEGATNTAGRGHKTGFMGKEWDGGDVAFRPDTWRAVMRVLKPGGHLLAFGGSRTFHRVACAIEDAGFELRDTIMWVYGSGFPKSLNVSKALDKMAGVEPTVVGERKKLQSYGANDVFGDGPDKGGIQLITEPTSEAARQWSGWHTSLKPSFEPIVVARKPLSEPTVAANVLQHGTGAINVDACRIEAPGENISNHGETGESEPSSFSLGARTPMQTAGPQLGRWPANLCHDDSDEVKACFPETGKSSGGKGAASMATALGLYGRFSHTTLGQNAGGLGDSGSAARFFKTCEFSDDERRLFYSPKASRAERAGSKHPTVKNLALMKWLCRLVCQPDGLILDPFAGSGTTLVAALAEGFRCVGIEREAEYVEDIRRRIGESP